MKDMKRKAHELAAIVESVAGILFDTPEPETEKKTARWRIGKSSWENNETQYYCQNCNTLLAIVLSDGDEKFIDPRLNGFEYCPYCGAEMKSEAGTT